MISAESVTVELGGRTVLRDQDFQVEAGTVAGVFGPSGAGKTTLLRVLAGLVAPTRGRVSTGGLRPGSIGLLAQHPRLVCNPRWTLGQIVAEPAAITRTRIEVSEFADRTGLDHTLLQRFPSQVSDGQLQRACLARLLVQQPAYVLCDEPTSMLDPIATADVVSLIASLAESGAGVAVVSHDRSVLARLNATVTTLDA